MIDLESHIENIQLLFDKGLNIGQIASIYEVNIGKINWICDKRNIIKIRGDQKIINIINTVCSYSGIKYEYLTGKIRIKNIVYYRNIAFKLCLLYSNSSTTYIAKFFNKDHSTVLIQSKKVNMADEHFINLNNNVKDQFNL